MAAHLHPELETLGEAGLRRLQEGRLRTQWERVAATSAHYRQRLGARCNAPLTLAGLAEIPCTTKDDLRASLERRPPFGEHVAVAEQDIVRVHRTSGLTGQGMTLAQTRADTERTAETGARAMVAAGVRRDDRIVHCLNYQLWTGGLTDHLILEAAGAAVVPFGVGNTRGLVDAIRDLGVTGISCTPSYPALIERVLRHEVGIEPRDLGLRIALFGGEAGLDDTTFRRRLEETWGFAARNANYGLSEVLSILGSQCEQTGDLHFHPGEVVYAEILDVATRQPQPIAEGTTGELVCTHLCKEAQPLLRYATRDVVTVTGTGPCACGRSAWRFRVTGRTDDMFNVRGVNVFPTAVRRVFSDHPQLAGGQLRIVLRGAGPYDRIEVRAEAADGLAETAFPAATETLERSLKRALGASARVQLLPFGALPRTAHKTSWIEREP